MDKFLNWKYLDSWKKKKTFTIVIFPICLRTNVKTLSEPGSSPWSDTGTIWVGWVRWCPLQLWHLSILMYTGCKLFHNQHGRPRGRVSCREELSWRAGRGSQPQVWRDRTAGPPQPQAPRVETAAKKSCNQLIRSVACAPFPPSILVKGWKVPKEPF